MASCPSCGTQVSSDFGMKTCPSCTLVFMVDIDGNAAMPEAHDPSGDYESESASDDSHAETVVEQEVAPTYVGSDNPQDNDYSYSSDAAGTEVRSEVYGDDSMASEVEESAAMSTAEPTEIYTGDSSQDDEYNENFISDGFQAEVDEAIAEDDPKDPVGVQRFDAHEASQLVDGPYYYDLTISGLDTGQIKNEVLKALTDRRFQWTPEEIKRRLRNGRLIFKNLNPVKAVLVVIKLQHIDVDIQWVQKLHTDPSVAGGTPGQV